jgi:UDP-glucuronate 4-epimerase
MKILVTGSAGFIGSHTTQKLLDSGHTVLGIDNLDPYYPLALKEHNLNNLMKNKGFQFEKLDILNSEALNTSVGKFKPRAIIHLAAKAGVRNSIEQPASYFAVNVQGTMNVLEAARAHGVKKVLAASSSSVYGNNTKIPFSTNDVVESQVSPYAASKRAVEVLAKMYAEVYGLPIQLFRFFTVYGPSGRPDMAPAIFARALLHDREIPVFGDLESERDYTYVDDITDGLLSALVTDDSFAIYNLGNNRPEPLSSLIAATEKAAGKKANIVVTPRKQGDVLKTWADIDASRQRLNYTPKVSLEEGMQRFYSWLQEHESLYT